MPYQFKKNPQRWDDGCHRYPSSETRHLDAVMNDIKDCEIRLTPQEFTLCRQFAKRQNESSRTFNNLRVSDRSDEQIQFEGYVGQCAVCRYLGVPFTYTGGSFRDADLPYRIEVKTRTNPRYDLKVRPDDADDLRCVHVLFTGTDKPVRLLGWIRAKDGKLFPQIDPERVGKPFHAVPIRALSPMMELREMVNNE